MYVPKPFQVNDQEQLYDFMNQNRFAILFSQRNSTPLATHLPMMLEREKGCLYGHMAKANPQWRELDGGEVLVVFSGPHTYISPSWYETNQAVPTWNYAAVHVTGTFQVLNDRDELLASLEQLADAYETDRKNPWKLEVLDAKLLDQLTNAIVGFKITITNIEGQWKLSQHHSDERRERVIAAIEHQDDDGARRIAAMMRDTLTSR